MPLNAINIVAMGTVPVFLLVAFGQHGGHGGGGGRSGAPERQLAVLRTRACRISTMPWRCKLRRIRSPSSRRWRRARKLPGSRRRNFFSWRRRQIMSADFSRQTTALKDAVEDAQGGNKYFLKSFSKSQKAGLKELTKNLEKADSEVAKQKKVLDQQVGTAKKNSEGMAGTADKLAKALDRVPVAAIEFGQRDGY